MKSLKMELFLDDLSNSLAGEPEEAFKSFKELLAYCSSPLSGTVSGDGSINFRFKRGIVASISDIHNVRDELCGEDIRKVLKLDPNVFLQHTHEPILEKMFKVCNSISQVAAGRVALYSTTTDLGTALAVTYVGVSKVVSVHWTP